MKWVKGQAVFIAALLSQALVLFVHFSNGDVMDGNLWDIGFLWYNPIGCLSVMLFAAMLQMIIPSKDTSLS